MTIPPQRRPTDMRVQGSFHRPFTLSDEQAIAWVSYLGQVQAAWNASQEKEKGMTYAEYLGRTLLKSYGDV